MKPGWYQDDTDANRAHYWSGTEWTGETRHISQASPLYSPNGSHYWDGMQWLPDTGETSTTVIPPAPTTPNVTASAPPPPPPMHSDTPRQKTLAEMRGEPAEPVKIQKSNNSLIKIIVVLVVVVLLATFGSRIIESISGTSVSGTGTSVTPVNPQPQTGEGSQDIEASIFSTAKSLETAYTELGSYPDAEQVATFLAPGGNSTSVYIAYYDANSLPVLNLKEAVGYIICGADTQAGTAQLYASMQGGLVYEMKSLGEGVNPCAQPFSMQGVEWSPADSYLQIKGGQAM